jgi:hypothetical protein
MAMKLKKDACLKKYNNFIRFIRKYAVLIILFVGVPIILCIGYIYVKSSFKLLDFLQQKNKNYDMVVTKDKINGVVHSVYSDRGGSFVQFNDSIKMWFEVSENKKYNKYLLCDFLQPNDSLIKNPNNDTLFIYRKKELFFFVLGRLNQH